VDECRFQKELRNTGQLENTEEKGLGRASPLTILLFSEGEMCSAYAYYPNLRFFLKP